MKNNIVWFKRLRGEQTMPVIKCVKCGKDNWWGVWKYKGEKFCGWCNTLLEVEIENGEVKSVKLKGQ